MTINIRFSTRTTVREPVPPYAFAVFEVFVVPNRLNIYVIMQKVAEREFATFDRSRRWRISDR
jgi:hypothetical protein